MMCSERELLLSDDHEGIIDLATDFPIGTPAAEALGLSDPVFHIKVTPNRPDALGVRGIARDLAAKGLGTLKPLQVTPVKGGFASPITVRLAFDGDTSPCPLFVGRYFRGVSNGPSPDWLARGSWRSGSGRSRRWSISPTTSPMRSRGRCMSSTPIGCAAIFR